MMFDGWFKKLKNLFDAYKMVAFFIALFGSNLMQAGIWSYNSEPVKPAEAKKTAIIKPQKTIIIHEVDNSYCDKKLLEHYDSWRH